MVTVFVDTNVLLQFVWVTQIDWPKLLGTDDVLLVVSPPVLYELDRHKNGPPGRLKDRARDVVSNLRKLTEQGLPASIGHSASLDILTFEPRDGLFTEHGLDPKWIDDRLIATILDYRKHNPSVQVCLVTDDLTPELKASGHGISVCRPPEKSRLKEEPGKAEKQLQELQRENAELRNRIPRLSLVFADLENRTTVVLPPPAQVAPERVNTLLEEKKAEHPKLALKPVHRMFSVTNDDIEAYNAKLDEFYADYERFLTKDVVAFINRDNWTFPLNMVLRNDGTCPASDIDVILHFPDGFEIFSADTLPDAPDEPLPPREPGLIGPLSLSIPQFPQITPINQKPGIEIRRTRSYDVTAHIDGVKQHLSATVDPIYITFASIESAKSFAISYRINAVETPNEQTGVLHVIVESQSTG